MLSLINKYCNQLPIYIIFVNIELEYTHFHHLGFHEFEHFYMKSDTMIEFFDGL
jgi:hypothetical protein